MGSTAPADALTGMSLREGEEVVALVLARRTGGYPDAERHAAIAAVGPCHLFEAASLPIRGLAGGYNDLVPHPGQAAVRFACEMAGAADWDAFGATALEFRTGAALKTYRPAVPMFGGDDPEPKVLGLAVFSAATWQHLAGSTYGMPSPTEAAAAVLEAMRDAAAGLADRTLDYDTGRYDLLNLRKGSEYVFLDGRTATLPTLSRCFGDGGHFEFSPCFTAFMCGPRGGLNPRVRSGAELHPDLGETLLGLAETWAAGYGLRYANRPLLPSAAAGQHVNALEVAGAAMLSLGQAAAALEHRIREYDSEKAADHLRLLLERMDALRDGIAARLDGDRPDPSRAPR